LRDRASRHSHAPSLATSAALPLPIGRALKRRSKRHDVRKKRQRRQPGSSRLRAQPISPDRVPQCLADLCDDLKAASATFYVQDPIWQGAFHLVAMPGVQVVEPMYGFTHGRTLAILEQGRGDDEEVFIQDARLHSEFRNLCEVPRNMPKGLRWLYGDFVEREGVVSVARRVSRDGNGEPMAILHVNFQKRRRLTKPQRSLVDRTFAQLSAVASRIVDEILTREAPQQLQEIVSILRPAETADDDAPSLDLDSVAAIALNAVGLSEQTGLASIYLFDAATHTLKREACCGVIDDPATATSFRVSDGLGIPTWVAVRRKALLIEDASESQFRELIVTANRNVKSAVAVPILSGPKNEDLVGVLTVEAHNARHFSPRSVKSIWYAANQVAVSHRLWRAQTRYSQLNRFSRTLLDLCWLATNDSNSRQQCLTGLAQLVRASLNADDCDIWLWDDAANRFVLSGTTFKRIDFPRSRGWSEKILKDLKHPVWLSPSDGPKPSAKFWVQNQWADVSTLSTGELPGSLHPKVAHFQGHLGIPIVAHSRTCGVAWIRYQNKSENPDTDQMVWAKGLTGQVGLVTECIHSHGTYVDSAKVIELGTQLNDTLFGSRQLHELNSLKPPFLEGHVAYHPQASAIGGDCYRILEIDANSYGIFVADGKGHGVVGALNMLPLLATFETSRTVAQSPPAILDRLHSNAKKLGVQGSAAYTFVERRFVRGKPTVHIVGSVSGHDRAILVRGGDVERFPLPSANDAEGGICGGLADGPRNAQSRELLPGNLLIFFTDGVSGPLSWNAAEQRYEDTDERAKQIITRAALLALDGGPKAIADAIMAEVLGCIAECPDPDDATILVVRVLDNVM
jgi:putative methionine-R-sulfoxide reductase with GAF domain